MTITKLVFCARKRPELSDEEFQTYWLERHGPLVRSFFESSGVSREHPPARKRCCIQAMV